MAVALIDDFDVDGELHLTLRHVDVADTGLDHDGDVGVVAGDAAAHDRVRRLLTREPQPQPTFHRFADGGIHFLGKHGLGGVIIERQDSDGADVGQSAAAEVIETTRRDERGDASGDCARAPAESPPRCPLPRP